MPSQTYVPRDILIFGATGYIGTHIIKSILNDRSTLGRIAIFTSESTSSNKAADLQTLKEQGVEVIVGDVTQSEDIRDAYKGIDTVISAVGRNIISEQINWIRIAIESETVKRFFPSEFGTDIEYSSASLHEKPHQLKINVRNFMRTVSNLEYTYIVTGPYADGAVPGYLSTLPMAPSLGSFNVQAKTAVLVGDGNGEISLTTPEDVGYFVVQALKHPEASRNRALILNSFTTTPKDLLDEFKRQCGTENWSVSYTSLDKLRDLESHAWAENDPLAPVFSLRRIWGEGATLYNYKDNELINAQNTSSMQSAVKAAIGQQIEGGQLIDSNRKFI